MPEQRTGDRRVQRTQRQLQDGLRFLLTHKPIDEISVLDVTTAADVNRSTFYDHYTDKLELLNALIASEFEKVLEHRSVSFDRCCASELTAIVLAVGDYLQQVHQDTPACIRHSASESFVDTAVTLAVRRILLAGLSGKGIETVGSREVVASMMGAAILAGVKEQMSANHWEANEEQLKPVVAAVQAMAGEFIGGHQAGGALAAGV